MQQATVRFDRDFQVLTGNARSQAAVMVLPPGESTGDPQQSEHPRSDQWLYVTAGSGVAVIQGREYALWPGALILIEAGEGHEIRNTGDTPLETLNVYVPPAYDSEGEPLQS